MSRTLRGSGTPARWGLGLDTFAGGTFKTNDRGGAYAPVEQIQLAQISAQQQQQQQRPYVPPPPMPSAPPATTVWNQSANQYPPSFQPPASTQSAYPPPAPTGISPQVVHSLVSHRDLLLAMLLPLAIAFSMPMIYWFTISGSFTAPEHGMFIATLVDTGLLFCVALLSIPVLSRTNKATFDGAMWWLWLYTIVVWLLFILDIVLIGITNLYGGELKPGLYFGCGITIVSGLILSLQSSDALYHAHSVSNKTSGKHHVLDSSMAKTALEDAILL